MFACDFHSFQCLDVPEGGYAVPHMQDYMPASKISNSAQAGYVNVRRTPPPPLSSIFPRPPQVPPPPMEKYYATTAIFKPIKGMGAGGAGSGSSGAASNTMSSKASSNLSSEHNYDDNMGTMNSQSTAPMINAYNSSGVGSGGGGGGGGGGGAGSGNSNASNSDNMQFQRARTYNFRSYPDNL